jgi:hypothetical protein
MHLYRACYDIKVPHKGVAARHVVVTSIRILRDALTTITKVVQLPQTQALASFFVRISSTISPPESLKQRFFAMIRAEPSPIC